MSHRVEIAPNNRAGCQDAQCKKEKVKITKGQLRLGTWVEIAKFETASWKWRHWGCVSGAQIQNVRDKIRDGDDYRWDALDGYSELGEHPEVQAKIRRVIEQGHIDPEDFNGDPEYNVLGKKGIRGRAKKPEDDEDGENAEAAGSMTSTPAKKTPAKRGRGKAAADDDEEEAEEPPAKKARGSAKKAKTVKEEPDDEDEPPVKAKGKKASAKAKAVKEEQDDEDEPPVKAKGKKAAVPKVKPEPAEDEDDEQPEPPKRKGRAAAKKAAVKKEPEPELTPASEPESELEDLEDADFEGMAFDEEEDDDDEDAVPESDPEEYAPTKRSRKGKAAPAKKAAAKGTRQSTRNKR